MKQTQQQFIKSGNYLIDEVKTRANKKGSHFFDADSIRFFSSRISELAWQQGGSNDAEYKVKDIYFITSEADKSSFKHSGSIRAFTIRKCDKDGDIETVSKFQEFATLAQARKGIKAILEAAN